MKNFVITLLFIGIVTTQGICRVGMGESFFETPGGHTICDCDPYGSDQNPVLIGQDSLINNIEEFYFYNNHIIGYGAKIMFKN